MQKTWQVKSRVKESLIDQLLLNKGIETEEQKQEFLSPVYANLHSPFLFKEMEVAVERIWKAIKNKESILIYSDYDADAVTANAVLVRTFGFLGANVKTYIPDRFSEGYGLNVEAFERIKDQGVNVVLTVDCGTNSIEEAKFCLENGVDLIITDHHEITGETPKAYALINPKNPAEAYPYRELTGVAVAFKLACALLSKKDNHELPEGYEKWLLDLVAIGTVADCHSLIGENRVLVKYGLQVLGKTRWLGLRALMDGSGLSERKLDTYSLGFVIAPRINAAGRIDHASVALDLLTTDDPVEAQRLALELERLNSHRQKLTESVMSEARSQLALKQEHKVLMAVGNDWPKGVVGLVAGKLTEEFGRPVLVLERGEEFSTGSARSIPSFNIVDALTFSKDALMKYGGHAAAAGFTLRNEYVEVLQRKLLDFAEQNMSDDDLIQVLEVDAEVSSSDLRLESVEMIDKFEPFGKDNTKPKFLLKNAKLGELKACGKEQQHMQIALRCEDDSSGKVFRCIAFNFAKVANQFSVGDKVDLVFELLGDLWNGQKYLKLRVIDMRYANA